MLLVSVRSVDRRRSLLTVLEKRRLLQSSATVVQLDHATVRGENSALAELDVLGTRILREAPLETLENLLSSGELELAATNGLDDVHLAGVLAAHADQHLANVDAG